MCRVVCLVPSHSVISMGDSLFVSLVLSATSDSEQRDTGKSSLPLSHQQAERHKRAERHAQRKHRGDI